MVTRRNYVMAMGAVLAGTTVSYATESNNAKSNVTTAGSFSNGQFVKVTPLSGSFSVQRGQAQVIKGVELYQLTFGKPTWSDEAVIDLFLMNGYDLGKVLSNPNSYIEVAVWYPDSSGSYQLKNGKQVARDNSAVDRLTTSNGAVKLKPTVTNEQTLYLLSRIVVPGGAPPGQQGKQRLQFTINVRREK